MARAAILAAVIALGELAGTPVIAELLLLAGLGVTFPVPTVGFRSLVPVLVPRRLWDQANAADSVTFDAAFVAGPALAGLAVTLSGRRSRSRSRPSATLVAGIRRGTGARAGVAAAHRRGRRWLPS